MTPHNLVELLRARGASHADRPAFRFLTTGDVDGGHVEWTYAELDLRARRLAARLQRIAEPGDRALLLFAPGLDFFTAFFGCLYAGVIAVPIYPPDPRRLAQTLPRMQAIAASAGATIVLTTSDLAAAKEMLVALAPSLGDLAWIAADELAIGAEDMWKAPQLGDESIAFLQYTSGSTGDPKGVVLTHANVLANQRAMLIAAGGNGDRDIGVNWMPLFHDFGLIGATIHTVYVGARSIFMSPIAFLKDPLRWLRAMSVYRGTISGGPDFAFARCARAATEADVRALDLSSWRVAVNGAEPVRRETMDTFSRVFAPAGFDPAAFMPAYGLAEATLIVTSKPLGMAPKVRAFDRDALEAGRAEPADGAPTRELASCGRSEMYAVKIVDPSRAVPLADGEIGEVWVRGAGVSSGYWNLPELSRATFRAQLAGGSNATWLRTGDLGFMEGGELYITGRLKDLIIVRGRNIHPQDLERCAEAASSALRPGCSAAFAIEAGGAEAVALVAEAEGSEGELAQARAAVRRAIAEELEVSVEPIIFVKPRTIAKTSSGKIQRRACKAALAAGTLEFADTHRGRTAAAPASSAIAAPNETPFLEIMRSHIARIAPGSAGEVGPDSTVTALGFDSLQSVQLATELSSAFDREIPVEIFFGQTLGEIAGLLAAGDTVRVMRPYAEELAKGVRPAVAPAVERRERGPGAVLLTGATGFLGRYLLAELLEKTPHDVFCLVRGKNGGGRLRAALEGIGRWREEHELRIRVVPGDLAAPELGLSKILKDRVAARVDLIYHCGASVNWSLPYEALRPENVGSVEAILELASSRNIPIHHVSSLGVFPLDTARDEDFREDEISDLGALRLGYFQSKWAAEKLLADARERGFDISIYRPGIIAGDSRTGLDGDAEGQLFQAFLSGIVALGKAPCLDRVFDLVPVDYVAQAIVALSQKPAALGRSFNLVNPSPMRQLDLHRALEDLGYPVREVPYAVWREEVLALPSIDPENPLARFAGWYQGLDPARMGKIELRTRRRLPVDDRNTRALLPADVVCPAFDRQLLATYVGAYTRRGLLPQAAPKADLGGRRRERLVEDLVPRDDRVFGLYSRGKERQWDGAKRIDWTAPLDPENPQAMPDSVLPLFGSELFDKMSREERARVRRHYHAWQLSQAMHGEQGALLCAAKLVAESPTIEGRLFAASQAADEARHLEIFSRLLREKLELSYPVTPPLRALLDQIFEDGRWDMTALGMQVLIEGLALATFAFVRDQSENPLIRSIHAFIMEDEARHVAFGRLTLKKYYPELTEKERDEREEFVAEASYLLRDRFQSEEVFEALGLPVEACLAHLRESGILRNYRAELFSRIVPVVRAIGLWGPRVKRAYGAMGILGFAHVDVDALAGADERVAREMEERMSA